MKPTNDETRERILIGSSIVAGILLLLLLLLLLFRSGGGGASQGTLAGRGIGDQPGDGVGSGSGAGGGDGNTNDNAQGADDSGEDVVFEGEITADAAPQQASLGEDQPPDNEPPPSAVFRVQRFENPPEPAEDAEEEGANGGGSGGGVTQTIGGVKVKGAIALVCDVSGSMAGDFPVLVQELRRKFPRNTPLILIEGCHFASPVPNAPEPQRLKDMQMQMPYVGGAFANDEHVYYGTNTTDAVIFAVEKLRRRTVVFNNDLQDSGSESAIDAFEELRKRHKFTLSGRSLNCEAPPRLLKFIKVSGGDFKVDTIGRARMPAVPWVP